MCSTLKIVKELRGFLRLSSYYRRTIKGYGVISRLLTNMLKKNSFKWDKESAVAFQQLKEAIIGASLLILPNFNVEFTIEMDASGQGVGTVLFHAGRPLAFMSNPLSD